jgi:hypothetical protein
VGQPNTLGGLTSVLCRAHPQLLSPGTSSHPEGGIEDVASSPEPTKGSLFSESSTVVEPSHAMAGPSSSLPDSS